VLYPSQLNGKLLSSTRKRKFLVDLKSNDFDNDSVGGDFNSFLLLRQFKQVAKGSTPPSGLIKPHHIEPLGDI
jgi:hypothetical protein